MSDKTGITELELQELLKDLGGESENEISEKEILLDLQGLSDDWEEEPLGADLSEEESLEEDLLEEEILLEPDLSEEETLLEPDLSEDETLEMEEKNLKLEKNSPKFSKKKTKKKKKKRKKLSLGWKVFLTVIMGSLLVLVVVAAIFTGIYIRGKQQLTDSRRVELSLPEDVQAISEYQGRKITYEGQTYWMQQDAFRLLIIGKNTDGAYSMVLMNFYGSIGEMSAMPIPRNLLNLDFSSAMYYDDMQEEVSRLLYGVPVHGYMVVDLQTAAKKIGQILSNTASDKGCTEILMDFMRQTVKNADNDMTGIWKTVEDLQDTIQWNMDMTELCYLYVTAVNCAGSRITEAQVRDSEDILPAILKTCYSVA